MVTTLSTYPSAKYIVASVDAPAALKTRANFVCDGVADEVQINAAAALGSVQLTDGRYFQASPVNLPRSGASLYGNGNYTDRTSDGLSFGTGSVLLASTGFTGTEMILAASGHGSFAGSNTVIRDLSIRGTNTATSTTPIGTDLIGIRWRSYQGNVDNVDIALMSGDGIFVEPYGAWDIYDTRFTNLHVAGCLAAGLSTTGADGHLSQSIFNNNGYGIWVQGSSWQITQVHCYSNTVNGIHCHGGAASRTKIANSKIEHSGQHGLLFASSGGSNADGAQVIGCGFNCNGETTDNTYAHLALGGPGAFWRGTIMGNAFGNSDSAANTPQYAVSVDDATRYLVFMGNNFGNDDGGAHLKLNTLGSSMLATSRFVGNLGVTDQGTG